MWDSHPTGDPIEIPPTFGDRLAAVYDLDEPPATVWEWWRLEGDRSDRSEPVTLQDAALAESSGHEVFVDGELGHVPCALDALAVAVRHGPRPAVVRTRDPRTDGRVTVAVCSTSVAVVPPDAVIALAIDASESLESAGSIMDAAAADETAFVESICRYQHAFESSTSYERWADSVPVETFPAPVDRLAELLLRLDRFDRLVARLDPLGLLRNRG